MNDKYDLSEGEALDQQGQGSDEHLLAMGVITEQELVHEGAETLFSRMTSMYNLNRQEGKNTKVKCPVCGNGFRKSRKNHSFDTITCKDKYHNLRRYVRGEFSDGRARMVEDALIEERDRVKENIS